MTPIQAIRKMQKEARQAIAEVIRTSPEKSYTVIAREQGVSPAYITNVAREHGVQRRPLTEYAEVSHE